MPNFILVCGPQAVGKMTVGQELSKLLGYKLFYNHMSIEIVRDIFDYDKEAFRRMNRMIRLGFFREFVNSNQKGIVVTMCMDFGEKLDREMAELSSWIEGYDNVYVVELEAALDERLRRNKTENRLNFKASKRNVEWSEKDLLKSLTEDKLNSDPGQGEKLFENFMKIDNTNLTPQEVSKMVKEKFNL